MTWDMFRHTLINSHCGGTFLWPFSEPGKNSFDGLAQMDSWLVLNLYVVYVSEELVETAHCLSKVRVLLGGFGILK